MTALSVRDLHVSYNGFEAVKGVDFDVERGGWLGLVGPNGSGKTSVMRAVVGTVPVLGEILFDGRDTRTMNAMERSQAIALVPQRPRLPVDMTVFDYVLLGRTPHIPYFGVEGRTDLQVVADALNRLDLGSLSFRPLGSLSGGEQQQVTLARALAQRSPLLLLDEPTSALDVGHQQDVLELVDELRREESLTVVSALHDLTLAAQYCDRLVLLGAGEVRAVGEPHLVLTSENIRSLYGASVQIVELSGEQIAVVPQRRGS